MKNVFVFGADKFNVLQMEKLNTDNKYCFHELFSYEQVKAGHEFPVKYLLEEGVGRLERFSGSVDAIVGYWDFPVSTMLPLLRQPFNLPSPSFEAVLKCEHKYWSRREQSRVVPEYIPDYCVVDPFAEDYRQQVSLDYPFWIKPVKSASSHLGFKVSNDAELEEAIETIRRKIHRFAGPFNYLLSFADLPDDIATVDGNHCIIESVISRGRQCTLEGYVYDGEVNVYGVVDSIREGQHRSSFYRYQYPSTIPRHIQQNMVEVTQRFLQHIGFNNSPFNIEYFWDANNDNIWLLEINARISKSHCPLFRDVDGTSHHKVMLELALGEKPQFPHRQGRFKLAAKFMWREYEDAIVDRVPTANELQALQQQFPGTEIMSGLKQGAHLSELKDQDSYSYEIAEIFIGGNSQKELIKIYDDIKQAMPVELTPVNRIDRNII